MPKGTPLSKALISFKILKRLCKKAKWADISFENLIVDYLAKEGPNTMVRMRHKRKNISYLN